MVKEITYNELLKELDELPDIEREIKVIMTDEEKRTLSRRRSNIFGSSGHK